MVQPTGKHLVLQRNQRSLARLLNLDMSQRYRQLESILQMADCPASGQMTMIEAGTFEMGSVDGGPDENENEKPLHCVTLKAFEIGRTAVTQGQWRAVMGANPSRFQEGGETCPVENVSWDDVQAFLTRLNQLTGQTYRLPSEAEWEYAARAGTSTSFWWGNDISPDQANYDGFFSYNGSVRGIRPKRTLKVDCFEANPWGLYAVHGNVWEWVLDAYHWDFFDAPCDGTAWNEVGCFDSDDAGKARRVLRGGSFEEDPSNVRSASRVRMTQLIDDYVTGFRIARSL